MTAKLRTFIARWPWAVWVSLGCLVYLLVYLVVATRAPIASWPVSVQVVIVGLSFIAIGALLISVPYSWYLSGLLLRPYFEKIGPKWDTRSDKAKEKFADSLMSVSTALFNAALIGIMVFPFTAFLSVMISGTDPASALYDYVQAGKLVGWQVPLFICLFFLPLIFARRCRNRAMNVYDELSPPAERARTHDAHDPLSTRAEVTATTASTNGGSRRRRRHRAK